MSEQDKKLIKKFWDENPAGTEGLKLQEGSLEYFEEIERYRYEAEPFIHAFAQFTRWRGKKVLEVGCGAGTDFIQFARAGADVYGVDLASKSIELTNTRLKLYGLKGNVREADSETLPFEENMFDLVYSWGVIHHTPDTEKAIKEIYRVLKPGGKIVIMIYHKYSWAVFKIFIKYGIFKMELLTRSFGEVLSRHTETTNQQNPLTKAYTVKKAKEMFRYFSDLRTDIVVTESDSKFIPSWLLNLFHNNLGWYLIMRGSKPR